MGFEEIYANYFRDVYRYLCGLCMNGDLAEELTQETFVKALRAIDFFDGRKDIRAWLFTIAKNTYFTYAKRQKKWMIIDVAEDRLMDHADLVDQLADQETAFHIHQFLHRMEEPYKEVFSLRVFGELPYDRIGHLFGKSAGWARVTYYRAKKKIIAYMEGSDEHEV